MVATHVSSEPLDTVAPHEVLGLPAHERDPVRIVTAAAERLRSLRCGGGSEDEVRRGVMTLIRRARDTMLQAAAAR